MAGLMLTSKNKIKGGTLNMKKASITIQMDAEKLRAVKRYMEKKMQISVRSW